LILDPSELPDAIRETLWTADRIREEAVAELRAEPGSP
jgi:hypothetical protein